MTASDFYEYCLRMGRDNRNYYYASKFIIGPRYPNPDHAGRDRDAFWSGYYDQPAPPKHLGIIYDAWRAGRDYRKEVTNGRT